MSNFPKPAPTVPIATPGPVAPVPNVRQPYAINPVTPAPYAPVRHMPNHRPGDTGPK